MCVTLDNKHTHTQTNRKNVKISTSFFRGVFRCTTILAMRQKFFLCIRSTTKVTDFFKKKSCLPSMGKAQYPVKVSIQLILSEKLHKNTFHTISRVDFRHPNLFTTLFLSIFRPKHKHSQNQINKTIFFIFRYFFRNSIKNNTFAASFKQQIDTFSIDNFEFDSNKQLFIQFSLNFPIFFMQEKLLIKLNEKHAHVS